MELAERINAVVKHSKLSVRALSAKIGVKTPQTLYEILKGKTKTLSPAVQDGILNAFPEINRAWLLAGEGEMTKYNVDEIVELSTDEKNKLQHDIIEGRVKVVPLYNLDVRGGFDDNIEDGHSSIISYVPWPDAHNGDFAVEVSGMSMLPVIPPGSRVLLRNVEDWRTYLELNILYTIELNDDRRLLKEVHKSEQGDQYMMLHSYNPRTPDQDIPKSLIRRVYKVVGIMTNYGF